MSSFWSNLPTPPFSNEGEVELRVAIPFLEALGYCASDIAAKHPVTFQEGRKGRRPEADFVIFNGPSRELNDSLLVVEAKTPGESFANAKAQSESYAQNLRAPFYLVTDGESLEIWQVQISGVSDRKIACSVTALAQHQGTIEGLLSKGSIIEYCRSILRPDAMVFARDISRYVNAEMEHQASLVGTISRSLQSEGNANAVRISSDTLIQNYPRGAWIDGPSGFGKSSLVRRLHLDSLRRFSSGLDARASFSVYLPDVIASSVRVEKFAQSRVGEHCPAISFAAFRDLLRDSGALFFCDGFERVSESVRPALEENLRSLSRNFPKVAVFVFSRPSAVPRDSESRLTLQGLNSKEQLALLETVCDAQKARSLYSGMPSALGNLAFHPLLLFRVAQYVFANSSFPTQLQDLFEAWIEQLLERAQPSLKVDLREALSFVAVATREAALSAHEILKELRKRLMPDAVFDALIAGDGVRGSDRSIEVQHEALADYLRALEALRSEEGTQALLSTSSFRSDSLLPIILISLTTNRAARNALWEKLATGPLGTYFDSLRFRADLAPLAHEIDGAAQTTFLENLLDGVTQLLSSHFPALKKSVAETLTGVSDSRFGVSGQLSPQGVSFSFVSNPTQRVVISNGLSEADQKQRQISVVNLAPSNLRLDSGRLIGGSRLLDALLEVVKKGDLKGRENFRSERLLGRVHYLEMHHWHGGIREYELDELRETLLPHSAKHVPVGNFGSTSFLISEVIEDVEFLISSGRRVISPWWITALRASQERREMTPEEELEQWSEHLRRLQLVYAEICEESFGNVTKDFGMYRAMPVRWDLTLVLREPPPRSTHLTWKPVETWAEAGVDGSLGTTWPSPAFGQDEQLFPTLEKMGRHTPRGGFFYWRSNTLPLSQGHENTGRIDAKTSVLREACKMIEDDLRKLFRELPRSDSR